MTADAAVWCVYCDRLITRDGAEWTHLIIADGEIGTRKECVWLTVNGASHVDPATGHPEVAARRRAA